MLKPSTKSTTLGAIGGFLLGTILTSPYWFPGVWQTLTKKTFPEWLTGVWPTMTPSLYLYVKLFLYTIAVGLFFVILWAIHQQKKKYGWLEAIVEEDRRNMERRIRIDPYSTGDKLHLNAANPYALIYMYIINISIHSLTLEDKIEGQFTYEDGNREYSLERPHIYWGKTATLKGEVKHGDRYYIELYQVLPHPIVDRIRQGGEAKLKAKNVTISFIYRDSAGNPQSVRVRVETWIPLKEQRG